MNIIADWFRRTFANPQIVMLVVLLVIVFGVILTMGKMLAPVLAAVVIAYLLEGLVRILESRDAPRTSSVVLVFLLFMGFLTFLLFGVTPLLWTQAVELAREMPTYISYGQEVVMTLPQHYSFVSEAQVADVMALIRSHITGLGQKILSVSIASIPSIITVLVYLILVPLLVFFFLKDKNMILRWLGSFLPKEHSLAAHVWDEVDIQIGNYVRGKFWEILIVGVVSYISFALLGLKYAILLSVLVGLSVLVPYIGAAVVTIPVAVVAYFQWGWTADFAWLMVAYGIIQALDGNVLVPLLFSEVVNLHPVAIIVAILVFGGLWGFWGVFFAIPLGTLVNAILRAWPKIVSDDAPEQEQEASVEAQ